MNEHNSITNVSKLDVEMNQRALDMIPEFEAFDPVKHLPESFYVNVVASRRSGKGVTTEWILNAFQKSDRKFDAIFLISPTGDKNFMGIPPSYKFESLDILDYIMTKQREIKDYNGNIRTNYKENHIKSRICVVIDDMAFSGDLHNSLVMNELSMNGRHISNPIDREGNCLSVIVLSQQLNKISPAQRRNNDFMIFNNMSSSTEAESVLCECFFVIDSSRRGKSFARKLYSNLSTSKDYRFIAVGNCNQNKRKYTDYIYTSDAVIKKPFKLFGGVIDWQSDTYFNKNKPPKLIQSKNNKNKKIIKLNLNIK